MKSLRQPLSESFFYGSPERPFSGSYRWVGLRMMANLPKQQKKKGVSGEPKRES
jgi:hypothetical protein